MEKIAKPQYSDNNNAPIQVIVQPQTSAETKEKVDDVDVNELIPQGDHMSDPLFHAVKDFFNLTLEEAETNKAKLSEILEWAITATKSNKVADINVALRALDESLVEPGVGERRYMNVHKYIRLALEKISLQKAMSAYEKKGNHE